MAHSLNGRSALPPGGRSVRRRVVRRPAARLAVLPAMALGLLFLAAPPAAAGLSDEQQLAEHFAPVVALVHQGEECGPGEPYKPSDVDAFLDNNGVALRGPWDSGDLVKIAPTANDLDKGLAGYYLDFPGNPLKPGCDYERWARTATAGTAPTMYAHVATEAGRNDRIALQYWFYYPFNDYNNKHESDWEMVQLIFAATDAAEALRMQPLEIGYSQHEGVEVARWGDSKLELVDGTHPVVRVASGSHANFFDAALFLGRSGQEGFGCDDTRGPADSIRPAASVIPNDPAAARAAFPWITYQGRWGQREQAFYNGPTGPSTKERWTRPISFEETHARDRSYAVPAGGLLGTTATGFFCGGVAGGSDVVRKLADNPIPLLIGLGVLILLIVYLIRRTSWRPTAPLRLARRRAAGQILAAAARMYVSRWRVFVPIGLVTVPAFLLAGGLQNLIVATPRIAGVGEGGEAGGFRVTVAALLSYLVIGIAIVMVLSATTRALVETDAEREVWPRRAYKLSSAHWRSLVGALLISSLLVVLFSLTVVLLPVAVGLIVAFALYVPVAEIERTSALRALRRSAQLIRHQILKVTALLAISVLLAAAVGPFLGVVIILATNAPFPVANAIAGFTLAFLMPYVALTMTYVYYDAVVRHQLRRLEPAVPATLPSELATSDATQTKVVLGQDPTVSIN